MGYPAEFKYTVRKVADHIVIASAPYAVHDWLNLGARMASIQYEDSIIVWSAMPYGPAVIDSLKLLTGKDDGFNVTHLIVPNREHIAAAGSFKKAFPNVTVIASDKVRVPGAEPDIKVKEVYGNKNLSGDLLKEVGITDQVIVDNFEFVSLSKHKNRELVVYDKKSKTIFASDLVFNNAAPGEELEQYSEALGFEKGYNPNTGFSLLTRYFHPQSKFGAYVARFVSKATESKEGLKAINDWDFVRIVPSHGNVIENEGKNAFRSIYKSVL